MLYSAWAAEFISAATPRRTNKPEHCQERSFNKSNPGEDEQPRRRSRPGDEKEPPGSFSYFSSTVVIATLLEGRSIPTIDPNHTSAGLAHRATDT